ncbi:uncharacterized protein LOC129610966 [Condylostylus longicornis]|uniref:uncharacterized protein LOC129610966 n=1 Tax=Condylostylus longicornis TaxID=2530218 RepID=UPI00244E2509|nr:uncharacterized protein LOC129610966 [Condylostylus longicornis]
MSLILLNAAKLIGSRLPNRFARSITSSKICASAPPTKLPTSNAKKSEESDQPIQFLGSKAASWHAKDTRSGHVDEMLWYQPYVVIASVAVFLIYFCILREENDIDKKLEGSLFDHISGLEEAQLIISYRYNKDNGLDVKAIEQRLTELGIDIKTLN